MTRANFLQTLGFGAIGALLIKQAHTEKTTEIWTAKNVYSFWPVGTAYYDWHDIVKNVKAGDIIELIEEPDNKHDKHAIAVYWNKHKIGYVPRDENQGLKRLLDKCPLHFAEINEGIYADEGEYMDGAYIDICILKKTKLGKKEHQLLQQVVAGAGVVGAAQMLNKKDNISAKTQTNKASSNQNHMAQLGFLNNAKPIHLLF